MRGPPPDYYDRRGPPGGGWRGPGGPGGPPGPRGYGYGPPSGPRGGPGGPMRGPMGPPAASLPPAVAVDREKVCPLLLRVFPKKGSHHRLEDFAKRGSEPDDEVQIYTWPDASLRELAELVKEVREDARPRGTRLSFAFVYPDRRGVNVMKTVGEVYAQAGRQPGPDDAKTLHQLSFQTGDFLSVAIL